MKRAVLIAGLAALVAILFAGSLMAGKAWVPFSAWFSSDPRWWIVAELRLPRAILGLAIGAALGLTGAVLQGYLRNPLADPAVVGVSSSAALGAVVLKTGRLAEGFVLFDAWREIRKAQGRASPELPLPLWRGEPVRGKRVLVLPGRDGVLDVHWRLTPGGASFAKTVAALRAAYRRHGR